MRSILAALSLLIFVSNNAWAQDKSDLSNTSVLSRFETEMVVGAGVQKVPGVNMRATTVAAVRIAYVSGSSPWGVESSFEVGGRRPVEGGSDLEVSVPVSIVRRLGAGGGVRGISGVYLSAGYASRVVALRADSLSVSVPGAVIGLSQRFSIGEFVLRPEYVLLVDRGRSTNGRRIPSVSRSTWRIAFGGFTF